MGVFLIKNWLGFKIFAIVTKPRNPASATDTLLKSFMPTPQYRISASLDHLMHFLILLINLNLHWSLSFKSDADPTIHGNDSPAHIGHPQGQLQSIVTRSEKTWHVNTLKFELDVLLNISIIELKSETDRALHFGARALSSRSCHTHRKWEITA